MTTVPAHQLQLQFKVRPPAFNEEDHPRDRKGRFIETGAEVRIWGGQLATVLRNVGGGKIEVQRKDGQKVVVHRNYLTVVARPDGSAPTDQTGDVSAAPVEAPSPDAAEVPELADGESQTLPDRGDAPDHLVTNPTVGEQVGDYTVGEYLDGPSSIDGWVVGVTEQGGPIVRTEDGQDWPLLPDAQMARNTENAPEVPDGLMAETAPDAPSAAAPEVAPLDSVNPGESGDSGVFADYASGREYRASAPLADNMTTLAETEDHDPADPVTLYRGVAEGDPNDGIQSGDFVTTNRQLAQDYAGTGQVVETQATYGDVLDDRTEPGGEEYIYRPQVADVAPETQAPEQQTPEAPQGPEEAAPAPETPGPTPDAPAEPVQAPETPEQQSDAAPRYEGSATHESAPLTGAATRDPMLTDADGPEFEQRFGDVSKHVEVEGTTYRLVRDDQSVYISAQQSNGKYKVVGYLSTYNTGETSGTYVEGAERRKGLGTQMRDFMREQGLLVRHSRAISTEGAALANSDPDDPDFPDEAAKAAAAAAGLDPERTLVQRYGSGYRMWYGVDKVQPGDKVPTYTSGGRVWIGRSSSPDVAVEMREVTFVDREGGRPTAKFTDDTSASLGTKPLLMEEEFVPDATASPDAPATQERDLTALSDDDLGAAADAAQTVEEVRAIADEYRRRADALSLVDQPDEAARREATDLPGDVEALREREAEQATPEAVAPEPVETPGDRVATPANLSIGDVIRTRQGEAVIESIEPVEGADQYDLRVQFIDGRSGSRRVTMRGNQRVRVVAAATPSESVVINDALTVTAGDYVVDRDGDVYRVGRTTDLGVHFIDSAGRESLILPRNSQTGTARRMRAATSEQQAQWEAEREGPDVDATVTNDPERPRDTRDAMQQQDEQSLATMAGDANLRQQDRDAARAELDRRNASVGTDIDRAYGVLSQSSEAEGMDEQAIRDLIGRRLRETQGEDFTDVVIGEHGVRIFPSEGRAEAFNVEDLASGPEGLPPALRPGGGTATPGISPERQRYIDALEAGKTAEGVDDAQRQRIDAFIAQISTDAFSDDEVGPIVEAMASTDNPTSRAMRASLDASAPDAGGDTPDGELDMSNEGRLTRLEDTASQATPTTGATGEPAYAATGIVGDHRVRVVHSGHDRNQTRYEVSRAGGEALVTTDREEALRFIRGEENGPDLTDKNDEGLDTQPRPDEDLTNMSSDDLARELSDVRRQIEANPDDTSLTERRDALKLELDGRRRPSTMTDDDISAELADMRASLYYQPNSPRETALLDERAIREGRSGNDLPPLPDTGADMSDYETVDDLNTAIANIDANVPILTEGSDEWRELRAYRGRLVAEAVQRNGRPRRNFGRGATDAARADGYEWGTATMDDVAVGDVIVVKSRGGVREARITSKGRTRVTVEYTTDGAVTEANRLRDYNAHRDLEAERASVESQAGRNWDYCQKNSTPEGFGEGAPSWVTAPEGSSSLAGITLRDGTGRKFYGEEALAVYIANGANQIEQNRQWIEEHPNRDAHVAEAGQRHFEEASQWRALARMASAADDERNAHVTTYTASINDVAIKRTAGDGEKPVTPPPPPPPPPIAEDVQALLDQVLADKSLPDNVRQRRATALSDRLTIMHKGLIVHRKVDGDREFVVATPDGFKHIVQDCRTQQHAIEMIDALTAITDADGNPFDWTSPGLQERIRETKGPNGESVGRMVASARAGVTVRRRKPDEWNPPVLPYGMSIGDLAPDSVHPSQNPDPQARREAFRKMVTFSDPKSGWYTDMGRIGLHGRDGFMVTGIIRNSDGQPVGKVTRSIYMNSNGEMEAHHDYLAITGQQQGQGFADAYYKHLYDAYDRQGVDVVTIQANIDVGGYAWARRGFGWDPAKHSVNRNSGYDNAFKSRADSNLARAAQQRDLTEAQRARIEKFREDLRTNTDWTPNQIANALSDIQWDAQTRGGKTVKMWPGKAAMLGTNWYGKFYVREREGQIDVPDPGPISRIPKGDIPSMSDEDLRNEAETLSRMGTEFVNDGVTGDALDALNARKANLMQEREARIQTASKALIPDGIDKSVEDLRPGDSVVVPIITERGPQLATVRGITTSDGGMTTVEVQYDDGEVRNVYLIGDMLAAKWRTGAPAHPMATPDTLAEGDRVALDDGTTAVVRGVERDGDEYVVDLVRDDGSALDLIVDRDGTVPRVSSYAETYTDPADMLDDEVDEEARRLSMRRVVDRETLSPEETQRLVALRAESERRRAAPVDMVYGDAPTARPRLYTYQRQNLVALNLDGRNSDAPDDVKQAALRVRNRMPLSAAQSRALADHLRTTTAGDDSLGVRQQRSRERLAVAFDISAAVAEGRAYRPSQPIHNEVTRVRPAGLTSGDTAIMRMANGSLQTVKVLSSRPMMRGTLVRMSVEREDGTVEDRIVDRDTDAWLMPDLDTSPAPTDVEQVGRELVSVNDVRPGDLLSIFRNGRDEQIRVGSIALDRDGDFVVTAAGAEGEGDNPLTVDLLKDSLAHRLERGPESGTPGFSALLPDGDVETIDPYDVKSGDYVEFPTQGIRGTVLAVRDLGDGRDASGNAVSTRSALVVGEDGRTQPILLPQGGRPVTRYSTAANNVGDDIAAQFEAQRQRSIRANARGWVDAVQRRAGTSAGYMLEDLDNGTLDRDEAITRITRSLDQQRMAFENRSTATNIWNNLAFDLPKMTPEQENQGNIGMQAVVARVAEDAMVRLRTSIEEAESLPDETETDTLRRILTQWRDDPPKRNTDAMVQSVMDSLPGFTSSDRQQAIGDVALRPDAPLGERMKAYRSKIGGAFGMGQSSKARYANFTAESLERGEVPEVKAETTAQRERATDGGPAQVAMDHLATVRAAGAEVGAEVDARYERHLSDSLRAPEGMEPRREGESVNDFHLRVNAYIDDLAGQRDRAFAELNDARKRAQDVEAQVRGYADFEDVRTQFFRTSRTPQQRTDFFEIRELGGPNDPAPNPQIKSFDEQWKALKAKHEAAHALALSNRMAAATARRKAVMEVLGEIRPTGGVRLDYQQPDPTRRGRGRATSRPNGSGAALTDRSALVQSMRQAEDVYPTEWLEALRADLPNRYGGRTAIGLGPLQRGHADWAGNIRLSQSRPGFEGDNGTGGVAVHELGHLMERSTPGLLAAQEAFLWSRTSTGEVGSRQRERVTRISGREVGYKDEFASHYTGRSYAAQTSTMGVGTAHESYEVFTTGIESLYAGSEYLDDDFRAFMLGVLAVL